MVSLDQYAPEQAQREEHSLHLHPYAKFMKDVAVELDRKTRELVSYAQRYGVPLIRVQSLSGEDEWIIEHGPYLRLVYLDAVQRDRKAKRRRRQTTH